MNLINQITKELELQTQRKFELWDKIVSEDHFNTGTKKQKSIAAKLLRDDPTIYAYAFFKDKNGKPFKLYPYQDLIANDPSKRIMFVAANQIGKSVTLCIIACHFILMNPGKTVLMTSRTEKQAMDLLREVKRLLNTSKVEYKTQIGDSDSKTELYIKHFDTYEEKGVLKQRELPQSRIIVSPATDAILGYPIDLGLPDEIAFYENGRHFYYQLLNPRTYTTKGRIIEFSNPNGQQGVFWEHYNDDSFTKYNFNFLDCPTNTIEEYEALKNKLTRAEFDSTVNARFTSPAGGFIDELERKSMQQQRPNMIPPVLPEPVFIFFDFAKTSDRTVRVTGVPTGSGDNIGIQVYEMYEYDQGVPYNEIIDDLVAMIQDIGSNNIFAVGWDNTGVGKGIQDFIDKVKMLGIETMPVEFSLQNKSKLYTTFKFLVEKNLRNELGIKIPFVEECDKQLAQLRFKRTARGYLQVHHDSERDRDDFPDALAGLCTMIVNPPEIPANLEVF